ncbi:MAG: helix-turn-helix transcriptional regulator [Roseobacter sp.]|jgi:DNA-binding CsgD family transcriptional regulator|nr:helix-turn-helix transcriptional regulator [Roseobacter sp.]
MLKTDELIKNTLVSIYDAALSNKNWGRALDACQQAVNADSAMFYQFCSNETVSFALEETSSNLRKHQHLLTEYNQLVAEGRGSNYDQEGLGYVHTTRLFSVSLDEDIWSLDDAYLSRPEVQIGMRGGYLRRSFVNLSGDPIMLSGLVFLYGRQYDHAVPRNVNEIGSLIAPHFSKAAEIFRLTEGLRQKYNAVLSVLDRVSTGVMVVSEKGSIIVRNRSAQKVLEEKSGLSEAISGRLVAGDDNAAALLKRAVLEASCTARGENDQSGAVIQIPRRHTNVPLIAVVSPLRDAEMEIEKGLVGALITLIDPSQPVDVQSDLVATAYGLTKAEARVAALVLQGMSNAEISDRFEVSPETVKTQISAVLAKSGCNSRVAFIWRVFQLTPPIE